MEETVTEVVVNKPSTKKQQAVKAAVIVDQPVAEPVKVEDHRVEAFYYNGSTYTERRNTFGVYVQYASGKKECVAQNLYYNEAVDAAKKINRELGITNRVNRIFNL